MQDTRAISDPFQLDDRLHFPSLTESLLDEPPEDDESDLNLTIGTQSAANRLNISGDAFETYRRCLPPDASSPSLGAAPPSGVGGVSSGPYFPPSSSSDPPLSDIDFFRTQYQESDDSDSDLDADDTAPNFNSSSSLDPASSHAHAHAHAHARKSKARSKPKLPLVLYNPETDRVVISEQTGQTTRCAQTMWSVGPGINLPARTVTQLGMRLADGTLVEDDEEDIESEDDESDIESEMESESELGVMMGMGDMGFSGERGTDATTIRRSGSRMRDRGSAVASARDSDVDDWESRARVVTVPDRRRGRRRRVPPPRSRIRRSETTDMAVGAGGGRPRLRRGEESRSGDGGGGAPTPSTPLVEDDDEDDDDDLELNLDGPVALDMVVGMETPPTPALGKAPLSDVTAASASASVVTEEKEEEEEAEPVVMSGLNIPIPTAGDVRSFVTPIKRKQMQKENITEEAESEPPHDVPNAEKQVQQQQRAQPPFLTPIPRKRTTERTGEEDGDDIGGSGDIPGTDKIAGRSRRLFRATPDPRKHAYSQQQPKRRGEGSGGRRRKRHRTGGRSGGNQIRTPMFSPIMRNANARTPFLTPRTQRREIQLGRVEGRSPKQHHAAAGPGGESGASLSVETPPSSSSRRMKTERQIFSPMVRTHTNSRNGRKNQWIEEPGEVGDEEDDIDREMPKINPTTTRSRSSRLNGVAAGRRTGFETGSLGGQRSASGEGTPTADEGLPKERLGRSYARRRESRYDSDEEVVDRSVYRRLGFAGASKSDDVEGESGTTSETERPKTVGQISRHPTMMTLPPNVVTTSHACPHCSSEFFVIYSPDPPSSPSPSRVVPGAAPVPMFVPSPSPSRGYGPPFMDSPPPIHHHHPRPRGRRHRDGFRESVERLRRSANHDWSTRPKFSPPGYYDDVDERRSPMSDRNYRYLKQRYESQMKEFEKRHRFV